MRSRLTSIILGILFLTATVARADKVRSDRDCTVKFSDYKTFMWSREPESDDAFMNERIIAAVNGQLRVRGLELVNTNADITIDADFDTEERHTWQTYYDGPGWGGGWGWGPAWGDGWGWGWGGGGWATTTEQTYEVGTITVSLYDARSRKLVWQGVGIDTVPFKSEKRAKSAYKQIEKMFRNYPPVSRE